MAPDLPHTVRAVDTDQLLSLEQEAADYGFSQRLPVDRLREHLASAGTHYLVPALVHRLGHRPEVSPQWRCQLLLSVSTGEQVWGLIDVLPDIFNKLPETLDTASRKDIVSRIEHAVTQREWAERMIAEGIQRSAAELRHRHADMD
ncbi:hypothetical protein [Kitasatospora sp. NPDC050543]|uniref:hypothetical protein n=1 Tax=Kitasatospora sp. NPDC050543 TaxID=3364054 RepID=UPI0037ABEE14